MDHYCVIGYPVKHSLSPRLHNRWFRAAKIPARYEAVEVAQEDLGRFMRKFRERFLGANVTIPHKESIIRYLDALSPEAGKIGAVNTIVNRRGKLIGHNTDVFGAISALRQAEKAGLPNANPMSGCFLRGKFAVVIGAGGAARAIVYGLKKAGARVLIVNRTLSHAKKLAKEFGCAALSLRALALAWPDCDILINATSVGMWPRTKETPLTELARAPIVMDIVYRPRMTRFLRNAKSAGCRIITGDKMFLAQAEKSFELWTGCRPRAQIVKI